MSDAESRRGLEELGETGQLVVMAGFDGGVGCEFPSVALLGLGKFSVLSGHGTKQVHKWDE
jgi:hypothetical protein